MFCAFFSSASYNLNAVCIFSFIASSIGTIEGYLKIGKYRILIICIDYKANLTLMQNQLTHRQQNQLTHRAEKPVNAYNWKGQHG